MKLIRYLRSLDTTPKWLIFVFATGSTWFFGQQVWFYQHWSFWSPTLKMMKSDSRSDWEWVFLTTSAVALFTYWAFFGFKNESEKDMK